MLNIPRLDSEISSFVKYIKPTAAESKAKEEILRVIQQTLEEKSFGLYKVEKYGSTASGYDLSYADLDLRLYKSGAEDDVGAPNRKEATRLRAYLRFSVIPILRSLDFGGPKLVYSRY